MIIINVKEWQIMIKNRDKSNNIDRLIIKYGSDKLRNKSGIKHKNPIIIKNILQNKYIIYLNLRLIKYRRQLMQISHQQLYQNGFTEDQSLQIYDIQNQYRFQSSQQDNQENMDMQQNKNRFNPTNITQSQQYQINSQYQDSINEQSSKQLTIITQLEQFSKSITQYEPQSSFCSHDSVFQPPMLSKTEEQDDKSSICNSMMDYQAKIQIYNEMKLSKIFSQWKLLVYKPILINHSNYSSHKQPTNKKNKIKIKDKENENENHDKQNIKIPQDKKCPSEVRITSKKYHKQIQKEKYNIKSIIKLKFQCFNAWKIQIKYKRAKEYYKKKIYRLFFITCSYLLQIRLRSIYLQEILKISRLPNVLDQLFLNKRRNIVKVQKIIKKSILSFMVKKFRTKNIQRATNKLAKLTYQFKIKKKYWKVLASLSKN